MAITPMRCLMVSRSLPGQVDLLGSSTVRNELSRASFTQQENRPWLNPFSNCDPRRSVVRRGSVIIVAC
jgi:hypothetical protein